MGRLDVLPCGINPERLLVHAADGTTPPGGSHEHACPYCKAAIAELSDMWGPVKEWARRDVRVPQHFVAKVMRRVRLLVQSPRHAVAVSSRGTTAVTSWVLGLIAAAAVRDTPGVARITGTPSYARRPVADRFGADGIDIAELGEHDIAVAIGVVAKPAPSVAAVAGEVRRNVMAAIEGYTGIRAVEVNISVDDLDLSR